MSHPTLTDLEFSNLIMLFCAWGNARRDPVGTCSHYGLKASTVDRLAQMTCEQIVVLVASLGHTAIFQARPDLDALIDTPSSLVALVAASRAALFPNPEENSHVPTR